MDADEEYGIDNAIRTFVWRKHYIIVQELMESNLKKYIEGITDEDTKEENLREIIRQVLFSLYFLHE